MFAHPKYRIEKATKLAAIHVITLVSITSTLFPYEGMETNHSLNDRLIRSHLDP